MIFKARLFQHHILPVCALAFTLSGCGMFSTSEEPEAPPPEPVAEPVAAPEPEPAAVAEPAVMEPEPAPEPIAVKQSHPEIYTVVRGDTLWDIAARFLVYPWVWPQIWDVNPQIENPHLIYPGDTITLVWVDGQPRLQVDRPDTADHGAETGSTSNTAGGNSGTAAPGSSPTASSNTATGSNGTIKLSPRARTEKLNQAIPTISANAIRQFTVKPKVLTREELQAVPYIIGNVDNHLISASDNVVYVRGLDSNAEALYSVYRKGKEFFDPESKESLGVEVIFVADAKVTRYGDPATVLITENNREVLNGDILLPLDRGRIAHDYVPRIPKLGFDGRIISLFDAIAQTGQNQTVAVNIGQRDGIEIGDILAVERSQGTIVDRYGPKRETLQLPRERSGVIMIVRTFDRVSYGLIMESDYPIHVNDFVNNP